MRDCENVDLREALPDFAADRMTGAARARVAAHIADCADCALEVELLRAARRAMTRDIPSVDVARIVAALPAPPAAAVAGPALVRTDAPAASAPRAVRPIVDRGGRAVRHRPMWTGWRVAAAVSTIAVGGLSVAVMRDLASGGGTTATGQVEVRAAAHAGGSGATVQHNEPPGGSAGTQAPRSGANGGSTIGPAGSTETPATPGPGMAVAGSISDLSDGEVEALLNDLEGLEASPSDEPDAAAPGLHAAATP
jgi:Putative zinc-finger